MKPINRYAILLGFILLIALAVRIWGVSYDLPYIYHPDEPIYVAISQTILRTGDLNPHFFNYPSLFFYINSLAYLPYYLVGKLLGIFANLQDIQGPISLAMGVTKTPLPSGVLLQRMVTVIFGTGVVGLTFAAGKQLSGKAIVGLLAALMVAVSPTTVSQSRYITPDTFVSFFTVASFLAAVLVYQQGKTRYYLIAALCAGLAASCKYNGGLIVLPLLGAHFLRYGKASFKQRNLYLAGLVCGLGFLATTPYALLDFPEFWKDFKFESRHYATGHAGMEGNTLKWYLAYMWRTGNILYILSVLGLIRGVFSRSKEIILLSIFPVVYFGFISSFIVRNDRTFLPLTPFLFLLAAWFLGFLLAKAKELQSDVGRKVFITAVVCISIAAFVSPIMLTIKGANQLTTANSREIARRWLDENLRLGSKIAIESYSPFVEPARFSVHGFGHIIDQTPEWYIENGFEYLIFSQGMYGRFYQEPERYQSEVARYDDLFGRFSLVKMFTENNFEIRIYKVE